MISAVSSIVIARQLSVSGRGASSAVLALSVLCGTAATAGVAGGVAYAFARLGPELRPAVARAGTLASMLLAVAGAGVFLCVEAIHRTPGVSGPDLFAAAAVAGAFTFQHVVLNLSLTAGSLRLYAGVQILPALVVLSATIAIALTIGLTVFSVIGVSAVGSAAGGVAALLGLRRAGAYGDARVSIHLGQMYRALRPHIGYSLIIFGTTSMALVVQRIDVLLVADLESTHAAGLYSVASQIGNLVLVVPAALGALVFRRGAHATVSHSEDATRAIRWTLVIGAAVAAVFAVLAPTAIDLLLGRRYHGSVAPLRLLLPGLVVLSLQTVVSGYVVSRGYARAALIAWLTAAVVGVVADVFVIPRFGIDGAAIVSSCSYLLVLVLHFGALRQARAGDAAAGPTLGGVSALP